MPRKGRGGRREGTPGVAYTNRTDLNKARTAEFKGQTYGTRVEQVEAQRQVPIQAPSVPGAAGTAARPLEGPSPGTLGNLLDPTARPDEPITAGLPFGPGPGPSVWSPPDPEARAIDRLRQLYRQTGIASLGRLLEAWEDE